MPLGNRRLHNDELRTSHHTPKTEASEHEATDYQHPAGIARRAQSMPGSLSASDVLHLQRTVGNRTVTKLLTSTVVQRAPYGQAYSESATKTVLNNSEGRASPVNGAVGHPRQHVGRWEKAERYAEDQGRTKSIYVNTAAQDTAIASALNSAAGQGQLAQLDPPNPAAPTRKAIANVATEAVDVKVVKAKIKQDSRQVKTWNYVSGIATKATVIVDSMGTGKNGDIHIQTAFPVLD